MYEDHYGPHEEAREYRMFVMQMESSKARWKHLVVIGVIASMVTLGLIYERLDGCGC